MWKKYISGLTVALFFVATLISTAYADPHEDTHFPLSKPKPKQKGHQATKPSYGPVVVVKPKGLKNSQSRSNKKIKPKRNRGGKNLDIGVSPNKGVEPDEIDSK